jgi:hypothetical protein
VCVVVGDQFNPEISLFKKISSEARKISTKIEKKSRKKKERIN